MLAWLHPKTENESFVERKAVAICEFSPEDCDIFVDLKNFTTLSCLLSSLMQQIAFS